MSQVSKRALVMAGGTGGHVFPALAVAEQLRARGFTVEWLGTAKGIEANLVPKAGIALNLISVEGVRGKGFVGLLKAPFLIAKAILQALGIIRRLDADVVVGFGGFASGPGGVAAKLLGKPLVIHEQNAVAGTTNRMLSRLATRVLAAFDDAFVDMSRVAVVGNPVRDAINQLPETAARFHSRTETGAPKRLLILGGSLGAKAINELVPAALAQMSAADRPQVWHQTGRMHSESTRALYQQLQVRAQVDAFIEDMAEAYAWADLVICRAGALTVSELMAAGAAAILIPLPNAIDDHQTWNARILTKQGAGIALVQKELTAEKLAGLLTVHLADRHELQRMGEKAKALAIAQSAALVAEACMEVTRG